MFLNSTMRTSRSHSLVQTFPPLHRTSQVHQTKALKTPTTQLPRSRRRLFPTPTLFPGHQRGWSYKPPPVSCYAVWESSSAGGATDSSTFLPLTQCCGSVAWIVLCCYRAGRTRASSLRPTWFSSTCSAATWSPPKWLRSTSCRPWC